MSRLGPAAEELVAVWRRSLTAHDEFLRDDLDELEAHVRTGVAARVADGVSEAEAFADAVGDLGPPAGIAEEFGKADPSRVWRCRLRRMLVGPLVGEVVLLAAMYGGLVARGTANWFWRPVGEVPRSLYSVFAVVVFTLLLGASIGLPSARMVEARATLARGWSWFASRPRAMAFACALVPLGLLVRPSLVVHRLDWITRSVGGRSLLPRGGGDRLLTGAYVVLPPVLIAVVFWLAWRERQSARSRGTDGYDSLWSRRVRWAIVGQVVVLVAPCAAHLARLSACVAWRAHASIDEIRTAHGVPYVATAMALCAIVAIVSTRRTNPVTRWLDAAFRWLAASPTRAVSASLLGYVVFLVAQRYVYAAALAAFSPTRYSGYGGVERLWTYGSAAGMPAVIVALVGWLLWRDRRSSTARGHVRQGRGLPAARA